MASLGHEAPGHRGKPWGRPDDAPAVADPDRQRPRTLGPASPEAGLSAAASS